MLPSEILIRKLQQHSRLDKGDLAYLHKMVCQVRELTPGEDFIRQGDAPKASAIVLTGMVARYHTLRAGKRQYLSVHIAGDWPDAQGLFLDRMDHSVCAAGDASLCSILHSDLRELFRERPTIGFAVWRETLIDAAMFREAITNNSSRPGVARLAHFFAEVFYRSERSGLTRDGVCSLPFSQTQIGETLGMSLVTVNRHLQSLRRSKAADMRGGELAVKDWRKLVSIGDFDPHYMHSLRPVPTTDD